jgi:hypothetical protein
MELTIIILLFLIYTAIGLLAFCSTMKDVDNLTSVEVYFIIFICGPAAWFLSFVTFFQMLKRKMR